MERAGGRNLPEPRRSGAAALGDVARDYACAAPPGSALPAGTAFALLTVIVIALSPPPALLPAGARAFTIMEVLISALLIALAMGSIVTINVKSLHTLRASRQAAAASQVLQQRVEMLRDRHWVEVSGSDAMAVLMRTAAESEGEFSDSRPAETMRVTVPQPSANGPVESSRSFSVRRAGGAATVEQAGDFSTEPTLMFEGGLTWRDGSLVHQRTLRTIVCRTGLTRAGLVGSVLGRPGSGVSGP